MDRYRTMTPNGAYGETLDFASDEDAAEHFRLLGYHVADILDPLDDGDPIIVVVTDYGN